MTDKTITYIDILAEEDINDITDTENIMNDDCLVQTILDFSIDIETRISAIERYYILKGNDTIELLSRITGMYQFSGTKSLEYFLLKLCTHSDISSFLKLEAIKALLCFEEEEEDEEEDDENLKDIIIESNKNVKERNEKRKKSAYKALDCTCYLFDEDEELPTPCKIEAVCMLMEREEYKSQSIICFYDIINNKKLECDYRYKTILSLEKRDNYQKWNIPDRDYFLRNSCLKFLFCDENRTMYRILASQYLLQKLDLDKITSRKVQNKLLSFATDEELDYNLRADAADTLLNLAEEHIKTKAREIIMILGRSLGDVRTVFDNAQNVHTEEIEESVADALEFLTTLPLLEISSSPITFEYINTQIKDILEEKRKMILCESCECETDDCVICSYCEKCIGINPDSKYRVSSFIPTLDINEIDEHICGDECFTAYDTLEKIKISLNRINIDRVLYSKYNQTLVNILLKVWSYLSGHEFEDVMRERMLEELFDMSGTCSSGFASRLINVMSGFGQFNIRISWEQQVVANFTGRLNARARAITNPDSIYYEKYKDIVELYMRKYNKIVNRQNANDLENGDTLDKVIKEYLTDDKEEKIKLAIEEFSEEVLNEMTIPSSHYHQRSNFIKFFRDNMLSIREELYEEFKDFMSDSDFDLASRKAISSYEGY
jgi:hypothetical protein